MTDVDYELPESAIAQQPTEPRDSARLLVDRGVGAAPDHRRVHDLVDELREGDLLVVNDTKVLPARLHARRATGAAVEVLLLETTSPDYSRWEALVRPSARIRVGEVVEGAGESGLRIEVGDRLDDGTRSVCVLSDDPLAVIQRAGEVPLPPYITDRSSPPERYQTVYAERPGSAAAPTAGLHLTTELLARLAEKGVQLARVELVVGLDTFRPVAVDDSEDHRMHSEAYRVPEETMAACRAAKRVVAVGTTTVRALESAAATGELAGRSSLFIQRPYPWQIVDVLMTNFHLPRTTLLIMIDAFVGPRWRDLYRSALDDGYRFLSFGDAMLLQRTEMT